MGLKDNQQILLIYPFGNSDLAFNNETTFPRGQNFRAHLEVLESLLKKQGAQTEVGWVQQAGEPFPSGLDFTDFPAGRRKVQRENRETSAVESFTIETARFPILFDTLHELSQEVRWESENSSPVWKLVVQPIVTDQDPPHPQDTIGILPVLETYIARLNERARLPFQIECQAHWEIDVNPTNYDSLLPLYSELYEQMRSSFEAFERVYVSLTAGTPQMGVAAGLVLAPDPQITFVYKPWGAPTLKKVNLFRERVRQETLERLRHLLDRFEFVGALELVQNQKTAFTFQELQEAEQLLQALTAWQNYDFQKAAQVLNDLSSAGALGAFKALCESLSREDPPPDERARFWRMKIADTVMRLEMAVYRRDLPAVLYHFYNYNDVCLAWGLNAHFPELDVHDPEPNVEIEGIWNRFRERCPGAGRNLKSELGKYQLLFALAEDSRHRIGQAFSDWFQVHERLRWFQDRYVDSKRNRLIHGSVQLQEKLFDQVFQDRLQKWGAHHQQIEDGQGPWLLLGLTYSSLQTLPSDSMVTSRNLVRNCAVRAWEALAETVANPPSAPGWFDWQSHIQRTESQLTGFQDQLESAFDAEIEEKQQQLNEAVAQWKAEIRRDIEQLNLRSNKGRQKKAKMLVRLKDYQSPPWGPYMARRFMGDDPQKHQNDVTREILAVLHPCLYPTPEWEQETDVRGLIGNYKKDLTLQQLFDKLYERFKAWDEAARNQHVTYWQIHLQDLTNS